MFIHVKCVWLTFPNKPQSLPQSFATQAQTAGSLPRSSQMYSLYHSLLAQHSRQLNPVRCGTSTITQLHQYFEDVVLENNLNALVIESLPPTPDRTAREISRIKDLDRIAGGFFLMVSADDGLAAPIFERGKHHTESIVWERVEQGDARERFVVIADSRFSALLASVRSEDENDENASEMVIWTFEPDVVYSALEYLMARVTAEQPFHASLFAKAVGLSMPKATSLQLTLGVTTKLARLLQEQAEREIAVNRIATTIRNSLDLDCVLDTAAREVGRALNVLCCAVRVDGLLVGQQMTKSFFRTDHAPDATTKSRLLGDLDDFTEQLSKSRKAEVIDGDNDDALTTVAHAVVPLVFKDSFTGILMVSSDDAARVWANNELLLLHTVADQLAVAVNQAHMYALMQQQALTDQLTGCYNRRSFEMQLEHHLHLATRGRQPLSLIMIDLDNFKNINDSAGHEAGDHALRMLSASLRLELRAEDIPARFGGDEFAIILPQANCDGALVVAERLRQRIESTEVPGFGPLTASFGLSSFPLHASTRDTLVVAADRALYSSKRAGRNRVSVPPEESDPYDLAELSFERDDLVDVIQRL